jgi:hypothetical protein
LVARYFLDDQRITSNLGDDSDSDFSNVEESETSDEDELLDLPCWFGAQHQSYVNASITDFFSLIIAWHVDPLLGNDRGICKYTTDVAK